MSPPPNDPRSPNGRGPAEPPRLDRTIRELETQEFVPPQPHARPVTTFGLAPMVTQPFPVFAQQPPLPEPASVPAPAPQRTSPGKAQPAVQVSVGRVQGIGQQAQPSSLPPQQPAVTPSPPRAMDRTFIAAGHRVVLDAPTSRPPVPAYPSQPPASQPYASSPYASSPPASQPYASQPYASSPPASQPPASQPYASQPPASEPYASQLPASQPYSSPPPASQPYSSRPFEDTRSRLHELAAHQPEPSSSRQPAPVPPRVSEPLPRLQQQAPTTSVDVNELLRGYPIPMPEVRLDEDSSTTWSEPMAEAPRYTPQSGRRPRVQSNEPTHKELGRVDERPRLNVPGSTSERDDIDVNRVLGRSNMKVPLLAGAVVIALGLLGVSLYVKNARDTATAALAAAPESVAAPVPPDTAAPAVGAPAPGEQAEEAQEPAPSAATREAHAPATEELPRGREAVLAGHEAAPDERRAAPAEREALDEGDQQAAPATDDAPAVHTTTGGVTAKGAAALYINGQYKEALAEYQLLARAYPKQQVYRELARILRRKLIETCMRTQPNRREQCKNM